MVFIYCIIQIIDNKEIKKVVEIVLRSIIVFIISILIYLFSSNMFLRYMNLSGYNGQGQGKNLFSDITLFGYVDRIRTTYIHMVELFTKDYGNIFIFRLLIPFFFIMLSVVIIKIVINKNIKLFNKIILLILFIVSPIVFDFSYIMSGLVNNRVQTSLFFIIFLPLIIDDKIYENVVLIDSVYNKNICDKILYKIKYVYTNSIKYIICLFVGMFVFICIGEHYNLMIHNKDFEKNVNYIVNKIYNCPEYKDGMDIVVVGNYHKMQNEASIKDEYYFNIHDKPVINNISWEYSMSQYFRMYGDIEVVYIANDNVKAQCADMASYPADGCVRKIGNNAIAIKFSD